MTHGSLFSGIGGFDLAAEWMGWENVFQVEIDDWSRKLLAQNFPSTTQHTDIKQFHGTEHQVDIITGGFPCQPFSFAGSGKQKNDERYLWPEMLRVIREIKPRFVIAENVSGIFGMVDEICTSLENEGYKVEPIGIEASCIGADHLRERYWFVAYPPSMGRKDVCYEPGTLLETPEHSKRGRQTKEQGQQETIVLDTLGNPFLQFEERFGEPAIFGEYDGLPKRLDVSKRLHGIGNAIDPRVVYQIFKAIEKTLSV